MFLRIRFDRGWDSLKSQHIPQEICKGETGILATKFHPQDQSGSLLQGQCGGSPAIGSLGLSSFLDKSFLKQLLHNLTGGWLVQG
jgi:hypothetical protein